MKIYGQQTKLAKNGIFLELTKNISQFPIHAFDIFQTVKYVHILLSEAFKTNTCKTAVSSENCVSVLTSRKSLLMIDKTHYKKKPESILSMNSFVRLQKKFQELFSDTINLLEISFHN